MGRLLLFSHECLTAYTGIMTINALYNSFRGYGMNTNVIHVRIEKHLMRTTSKIISINYSIFPKLMLKTILAWKISRFSKISEVLEKAHLVQGIWLHSKRFNANEVLKKHKFIDKRNLAEKSQLHHLLLLLQAARKACQAHQVLMMLTLSP